MSENVSKRPVKRANRGANEVLLDSSGYAKLCDMGFARFVLSPEPNEVSLLVSFGGLAL